MNDSKLIQTLRSFTKDEIKLFEKFIASPYFNNGRNYLPILTELKNFYPEFNDYKLTSENLYKKLYPGRKFNKQVMWNLVSQLEKLALEFLLQTALKGNKADRFAMMFAELSKRNLDKQIFKEIEKVDDFISTLKLGREYFSVKLVAENNKSEYWTAVQGRQDKGAEGRVKSTEYLLLNLLVDLSRFVPGLQINKLYKSGKETAAAIEFVKSLELKKLADEVKKNNHKLAPLVMFYYNKIMCSLDEEEEKYFFEMKKFFDENYSDFDIDEQSHTIISMANYCSFKARAGNEKFQKIHFEINKFRLEKNIGACVNGRINKALYHQILRNALSLGEIKWAENFVKEYSPKLKKEHQKPMNALAWGYIYYAKKEYESSIKFLNKVEFIDLRDKLHVRILSAKAYFELNNTELLYYFIDSAKHFIGNNPDIESAAKQAYLKFFNYLKKLLTYRENPDQKKLKELIEDIELDRILTLNDKSWLLQKTDEL